jgi:isochorismate synthase EntC
MVNTRSRNTNAENNNAANLPPPLTLEHVVVMQAQMLQTM